jgi:hypothetical protein
MLYFLTGSLLLCYTTIYSHAAQVLVGMVTCPDGSVCPDGNTCCATQGGGFGCCPQEKAVCCDDKVHCCPQNTRCDVAGGGCISSTDTNIHQQQWMNRFLSIIRSSDLSFSQQKSESMVAVESELAMVNEAESKAESIVCPDHMSYCPDGSTCCLMPNHQWVCCPLPYAACCPDGFHCCPYGYRCDIHSFRCTRGDSRVTFVAIVAPGNSRKNKL